ncbi:MAG: hypothetical protein ACUVR4_15685 [Anaerolineae bacterium]
MLVEMALTILSRAMAAWRNCFSRSCVGMVVGQQDPDFAHGLFPLLEQHCPNYISTPAKIK